jgi:hypothetical protein
MRPTIDYAESLESGKKSKKPLRGGVCLLTKGVLISVRCCADVEEGPIGSWAQEARAYGHSRGVIPLSCAYFAADASTRGRTSA